MPITLKVIEPKGEMTPEMKNNYLMYRKVTESLGWNATYRKEVCPDIQRTCPHYSLGKVALIFDAAQADALLFVIAYNEIETAEAKEARQRYNIKRAFRGPWARSISRARGIRALPGIRLRCCLTMPNLT